MHGRSTALLALGVLFLTGAASATEGLAPGDHRVALGWTDTPPVIDGVMDDPGWLDLSLIHI